MNYSEIVKDSVSMVDVCGRYGISVNRSGFASCPFHGADRHPSMKVYEGRKGFHCFTCGAGYSVIDFAMRFFGIDFNAATQKLAEDFNLALPSDGKMSEDDAKKVRDAAEKAKAERERRNGVFDAVRSKSDAFYSAEIKASSAGKVFASCLPEDVVAALKNKDRLAYEMDCANIDEWRESQ